jgi:hypothetical protein
MILNLNSMSRIQFVAAQEEEDVFGLLRIYIEQEQHFIPMHWLRWIDWMRKRSCILLRKKMRLYLRSKLLLEGAKDGAVLGDLVLVAGSLRVLVVEA